MIFFVGDWSYWKRKVFKKPLKKQGLSEVTLNGCFCHLTFEWKKSLELWLVTSEIVINCFSACMNLIRKFYSSKNTYRLLKLDIWKIFTWHVKKKNSRPWRLKKQNRHEASSTHEGSNEAGFAKRAPSYVYPQNMIWLWRKQLKAPFWSERY